DVSRLTPAELTALLAVPPQNDSFESGRDFMARVRAWLDDVPATGTTIAFTHYAVVREILGALLGSRHAPTEISHASIHHFRLDDSGIHIVASNDIEHLQR
ncbi:MAG: histidine phosphatase family protein, partial [Myxococcales bacterium]|nr:histidine phosphatase family protein [Myxococcales bacterium]